MTNYIMGVMITVLEMICCKVFFEAFGEKRSDSSWRNLGIFVCLIFFVHSTAYLLYNQFFLKEIVIIFGTAVIMFMYMKNQFRKLLILSLLFQGLLLSIDYFALWLIVTFFESIQEISASHYVGGCLVTILAKVFLFMIVIVIQKKIGDKSSNALRDTDWLRLAFFPVFTIFTIMAMLLSSGSIENQKQENVFLVVALCMAGMNAVAFCLIDDILKREMKIRESEIFKLQVQNQTDMYRSISENNDKQRKRTHEYRNQIMCIEALIASKRYDELEGYVKKISGFLGTELDYIKTNHVIIDAILNSKYREMSDKKILFIFKLNDLSEINISDEDIVVILSNLLNNAIEACEKCNDKKVIKIKFVKEKNQIILAVRNTYDGMLIKNNGEIQTSKKYETDEHGIGIKNVVDVITKYQGSYVIQNDEDEFVFSIIIPCEKSDLR